MASGIYAIINTESNKIYIGSTNRLRKRRNEHFTRLRHNNHTNKHLQNSWNKYGEDAFEFRVLEECEESVLMERENFYIDKYNSIDRKLGYNIDKAERHTFSKEHCENISKAKKGKPSPNKGRKGMWKPNEEQLEKMRIASMGRKQTPESIEKISSFHRGRKRSEATKEKLRLAWEKRKANGETPWNKGVFGYKKEKIS